MQVSTDPIERMAKFLMDSPSIPILPIDHCLSQTRRVIRRPTLDYVAILDRLRDGKSIKRVAYEMSCSPLSVYKVLSAHNFANPSDAIELVPSKFGRPRQC